MSRYNKPTDRTWKDFFIRLLIIASATFILVWFLPRGERTAMTFEANKPWPYGRFIAPYDFPILKTEAQLQRERDSLMKTYEPYFELQQRVENQQVEAFRKAFRKYDKEPLPGHYRAFVEMCLHEIYSRGVISNSDLQTLQLEKISHIHIFQGTEASSYAVSDIFSEKSAYEYIFSIADQHLVNKQKLQQLNLNLYIKGNLLYDEEKSNKLLEDLEHSVIASSGYVQAGQNIIDRGDIITEEVYQILESYNQAQAARRQPTRDARLQLLGQAVYVGLILLCMVLYFDLFRQDYANNIRSVLLLSLLVLSFPLMTSFLMRHTLLSVYLIPYAMLPIFVRVFMDSRTAFFTHVCMILLCAMSLRYPFEFITTQLLGGLIAIYSLRDLSERSQIIRTAFMVTAVAVVFYMSIDLMHGRKLFDGNSATLIDWGIYTHIVLSGLLLLFAYPLMYLLERIFGFTSNVTLVELSNINNVLLRRLSEQAPGTFQHSMMVSNLAAEVANKIGAKSQLVRTGALYHDIGKLENPEYFTENQLGGLNPHNNLSCKDSATIILRHVTDGLALADKYNLPKIIRDFISTHHGRGLAKYFYITQKNAHPDEPINMEDYTYIGPNPSTTEQAILMMVDAVEATARSLKEYTEESVGALVDKIIDGQVTDGFFRECPITFRDIQMTKQVLKEKLKTIYHTRVSYPTLHEPQDEVKENDPQSGSTSK